MLIISTNSQKQEIRSNAADLTIDSLNTEALENNRSGKSLINQAILERRKVQMEELAYSNPSEFLNKAMSADVRNSFPENQRSLIEERVNITGELLPFIIDNFETNEAKTEYIFKADNLYYNLDFVKKPSEDSLGSGNKISLDGYILNNHLVADNKNVEIQNANLEFAAVKEKKIAIWPLNFTDDRSEPWSKAEIKKMVFCDPECKRSVKTYYEDVSDGKLEIIGKVLDWWKSDMSSQQMCVFGPPSDKMLNKAKDLNPNIFNSYDGIVFIFNNTHCGTPFGQSTIGGDPSIAIVGQLEKYSFIHELGHSFGLAHSPILNCDSGDCWDKTDTMGMQMANMNPLHKLSLNFIPKSVVKNFSSNGTYRIFKTGGQSPQVIKIDVPNDDWDVYLDYRDPNLKYNSNVPYPLGAGVLIYRWDGKVGKPESYTKLIDITPGDGNENNLVLKDGKSAGWIFVKIEQIKHTDNFVELKITKS